MKKFLLLSNLFLLTFTLTAASPAAAAQQPDEESEGWCETYEENCERPQQPEEAEPTRPGNGMDEGDDPGTNDSPFFEG